jgi:hypothetical protein
MDHLLLGVADLDLGIAWVERMTGVKPVIGGSHPGTGTRNALLGLGGKQYLEIIAPDPLQPAYKFHVDVRTVKEPRLISWAVATTDIHAMARRTRESRHPILGPREGSRARPDGRLLRWQTLSLLNRFGTQTIEPIPFFIEWAADLVHPSQDAPKGCELQAFEIEHPDAASVIEAFKKLQIAAKVTQTENVRLTATLKTPRGKVVLT